MVDDGPRELPAKPAHTAVCHRGGVAILSIDALWHSPGSVNMGDCLARPDRTIKTPPGRDPGRRLRGKSALAKQRQGYGLWIWRLQSTNSRQRQNPLKDSRETDQHHEQLEKICKSSIADKLVDAPETNRADDANNQNTDQK